jgi:hypothetical protein
MERMSRRASLTMGLMASPYFEGCLEAFSHTALGFQMQGFVKMR